MERLSLDPCNGFSAKWKGSSISVIHRIQEKSSFPTVFRSFLSSTKHYH